MVGRLYNFRGPERTCGVGCGWKGAGKSKSLEYHFRRNALWVVVGREQEGSPENALKLLFSQGPFQKEFHLTIINFLNCREGSMGDTKARIHLIFPKI